MILYPNCKINLGLNIVGRRPDGYHNIETVFLPIPLVDILEIDRADCDRFQMDGQPLDCQAKDNLVVRVVEMLRQDGFDVPPVEISLTKNIPSGAGLGGGSADSAFMMRGLNSLFDLGMTESQMEQRVSRLGADCAVFVKNRPVFAEGIGNVFTELTMDTVPKDFCVLPPVGSALPPVANLLIPRNLSGYWLVLIKPDVHISTRDAYAGVHPSRSRESLMEIFEQPVRQWRGHMVNDFEDSVFAVRPQLKGIRDELYMLGADYAAMSGSGSTIFGLFPDKPMLGDVFHGNFEWEIRL